MDENGNERGRIALRREQEAQVLLEAYDVTPRQPVMAPKPAPSKLPMATVQLDTNIRGMSLQSIPIYRYDVKIIGHSRRKDGTMAEMDFTKPIRYDILVLENKQKCRDSFIALLRKEKVYFGSDSNIVYDMRNILYSVKELEGTEDGRSFELDEKDYPTAAALKGFQRVNVFISKVTHDFELTLNNLASSVTTNLELFDHSVAQFIDLATSQYAILNPHEHVVFAGGKNYLMNPEAHGFTGRDCPPLSEDVYLAVGSHKSVRFVEGPKGPGHNNAAVVIESKKTPFRSVKPLLEIVQRILSNSFELRRGDLVKLERELSGIWIRASHTSRLYRIKSFTDKTARTLTFNRNGKEVDVLGYFKDTYKMDLKYPDAPLVAMKAVGKDREMVVFLPVEVCEVVDNQRVSTQHQTPAMLQTMIKACAVPPAMLQDQSTKNAIALNLGNELVKNVGINVISSTLKVTGRQIPAPQLEYQNGQTAQPNPERNFTWMSGRMKYFMPATVTKWGAMWILGGNAERLKDKEVEDFFRRFQQECEKKGMRMPAPVYQMTTSTSVDEFKEKMRQAKSEGVEYILFVHTDTDKDLHDIMKQMESELGIVTQGVRSKTVSDILQRGRVQTLENLANKANMKMGGLNYSLDSRDKKVQGIMNEDILFLGIGMEHPMGDMGNIADNINAPPSVVGYAANTNAHPFEFVGDFALQECRRDEKLQVLVDIVETCVDKCLQNRNKMPEKIIVYRNGCSEGQFAKVIQYEVPLIYAALKNKGCNAKVTVIVVNKMHNVRFFPKDINPNAKAPDQNVKPGTVVDSHAVHPKYSEFYLNAHVALQGTAKTPRYTVLVDDNDLSADRLQYITYWLSYGHQIVALPTGLPSPAYIAMEYAKRGRSIFNAHTHFGSSGSQDRNRRQPLTHEEIAERYSYAKGPLGNKRTNA